MAKDSNLNIINTHSLFLHSKSSLFTTVKALYHKWRGETWQHISPETCLDSIPTNPSSMGKNNSQQATLSLPGCKLASADSRFGIPFCNQDLSPCQSQQGALKQYEVPKLPLKPFLSQPTGVPTRKSFKFLGQFSMGIKKPFVAQLESQSAWIGQGAVSFRSFLLLSRSCWGAPELLLCADLGQTWCSVKWGRDCFSHYWRIRRRFIGGWAQLVNGKCTRCKLAVALACVCVSALLPPGSAWLPESTTVPSSRRSYPAALDLCQASLHWLQRTTSEAGIVFVGWGVNNWFT